MDLITANNAAHIVKSPDINIHTHYFYAIEYNSLKSQHTEAHKIYTALTIVKS